MRTRYPLERVGRRDYCTKDGRYRVRWERRQGARSCWIVSDTKTMRPHLRAFTLVEARETLREMIAGEATSDALDYLLNDE